jgi:hypothetical protein
MPEFLRLFQNNLLFIMKIPFQVRCKEFLPFFLALAFFSSAKAESSTWIDSAQARYVAAAESYDSVMLRNTAEYISGQPPAQRTAPKALLLWGLVYWRLELIAYCVGNTGDVNRYGAMAVALLDNAEKAGADGYVTASHRALVCQLIYVQGGKNALSFGFRSAKERKKAKRTNPQGYFTLMADALNAERAPAIAGGNPKKAVALFEQMAARFPDSIDVKIQLADSYLRVGRKDDWRRLIEPVVAAHPHNLLAWKVAAGIRRK